MVGYQKVQASNAINVGCALATGLSIGEVLVQPASNACGGFPSSSRNRQGSFPDKQLKLPNLCSHPPLLAYYLLAASCDSKPAKVG
jgi:hypothetical protein